MLPDAVLLHVTQTVADLLVANQVVVRFTFSWEAAADDGRH